jgi:outer membrane protein assembly factor BamB
MMRSIKDLRTRSAGLALRPFSALLTVLASILAGHPVNGADGGPPGTGWLMRGHDARRTGRALNNGPRKGGRLWEYTARNGALINMEAAVTERGVFFGTWGVVRRQGASRADWDKMDGRIYGVEPLSGRPLWEPLHPGRTPYAYAYAGRPTTEQDRPAGPGLHWSYYNGTVEGTPAVDPSAGTLYVGRGDGGLYAVDPVRGTVRWRFNTFDPARPGDPEGGGEVIGGPLLTSAGAVVFATFAAPHRPEPPRLIRHETNAVYAVSRSGVLLWRYPRAGSATSPFLAPVALSPDGRRVYAVTALPEPKFPCELLALDAGSGRLLWRLDLGQAGGQDMAVGIDGTIYVAGILNARLGSSPAVVAVADRGGSGAIVWGPRLLEGERPKTHAAGGLALFERDGRVADLWVTTTMLRELNGLGGKLLRLDPASGRVAATWDPEAASPGCSGTLTDVSLDNQGVLYVGVRGRHPVLRGREVRGRMYALRFTGGRFEVLWSREVQHQIDWASPAIGPTGGLYFGSSATSNPLTVLLPPAAGEDLPNAHPIFYGVSD